MNAYQYITVNHLRLAYLDQGGTGLPVVCLHGHFGRAGIFKFLPTYLGPRYRVIALEQRGHGLSDKPDSYTRQDYVADILAFITALKLPPCVLLGHSLGGVNAYQSVARQPELFQGLIVEDIGAVCQDDLSWCLGWPRRFPTMRAAVEYFTGPDGKTIHYFMESLVEHPDGWGLMFQPEHMVQSGQQLNGDHWADWLASRCPALLLRGGESNILSATLTQEMTTRRPHTTLQEFPGAPHNINEWNQALYGQCIRTWLDANISGAGQ
jgi:esterase